MKFGFVLRSAIAVAAIGSALTAGAAQAQQATPQGLSPWDGSNPFECEIQDVGFGIDFPDPGADPFCVEFNKTRQNITELGVVDFLLQEPARVAAAVPKCRYYQRDSWRGYIVQGNPATGTYAFDGRYFFDKSTGAGGVYVENFSLFGQSFDPRLLPGFPEEYKPYFGPGRGGVRVSAGADIPMVPGCVRAARAEGTAGAGAGATGAGDVAGEQDGAGAANDGDDDGSGDGDPRFAESSGSPKFAG